jgi:sarcosine oxidase subunit delta
MRIPCPYCGERGSEEFAYLGDATVSRPGQIGAPMTAWMDYVYLRQNPAGDHRELWQHVHGCRRWIVVKRNTRSHSIDSAFPAGEMAADGRSR